MAFPKKPKAEPRGAPTLIQDAGQEHRSFPRARMEVPFHCWIGAEDDRRFSATLQSTNVSVSGCFLRTTFFLPMGTELNVRFTLEGDEEPVEARGEIVREERPNPRSGEGDSGIGLRFTEFFGQTEISLARLFLEQQLATFVRRYLDSPRSKRLDDDDDRIVDAVAAWELSKVTQKEKDPWRTL